MIVIRRYDPEKHHRRSIRLKGYDYSREGCYFITLRSKERGNFFGQICNGIMHLNDYGILANDEWVRTPGLRPGIETGAYIIMPDHIHGILIIRSHDVRARCCAPQTSAPQTSAPQTSAPQSSIPPAGIIGSIVRGYKATVTKQINIMRNTPRQPVWQRNYYERIIRNDKAFRQISEYIRNNPLKWKGK